jgi:hypothetical protein
LSSRATTEEAPILATLDAEKAMSSRGGHSAKQSQSGRGFGFGVSSVKHEGQGAICPASNFKPHTSNSSRAKQSQSGTGFKFEVSSVKPEKPSVEGADFTPPWKRLTVSLQTGPAVRNKAKIGMNGVSGQDQTRRWDGCAAEPDVQNKANYGPGALDCGSRNAD